MRATYSAVERLPGGRTAHLAPGHPLARVARERCRSAHGNLNGSQRVGGVACGQCWEVTIRDDERAAVLFDLPRALTPDPDYVDEIAVELACRGERVRLTHAERRAAAERLATSGYSRTAIGRRLRMNDLTVTALLADLPDRRAA